MTFRSLVRSPLPRFVALVGFTALPLIATAANAQQPQAWPAAVTAFDQLLRTDSVVGASLAYMKDGKIVRRHDVGFADRAGKVGITPRSIFHYGSITKTLTAVAVLQLRDQGLLSLDDPITKWIPELRQVHNAYGSMDAITLRMLLSHSSGFQNPTWPWRKYESWEPFEPTRWDQLVAMMPYMYTRFAPGARYSYSNPGYIYLARVIESITGDPWQSYIYKNIWGPLGIRESYFNRTPWHLAPYRSNNYTLVRDSTGPEQLLDNGREFDPGVTIPNGGWNAPLGDVGQWVSFLAGLSGETVLKRSTLEEMWRPVVPTTQPDESMGLGFFLETAGGTRLIGHTGEQAGFRSFFFLNPVTRAAILGVVNTTNEARPEDSGRAWLDAVHAAQGVLR
ncbi:MAG: serine hydrolase domain-containing protein [Gemmatimonadales bacterium]